MFAFKTMIGSGAMVALLLGVSSLGQRGLAQAPSAGTPLVRVTPEHEVVAFDLRSGHEFWRREVLGAYGVCTVRTTIGGSLVLVERRDEETQTYFTCLDGSDGNQLWTRVGQLGPQRDVYLDSANEIYTVPLLCPFGPPDFVGPSAPDLVIFDNSAADRVAVVDAATGTPAIENPEVGFAVNGAAWLPVSNVGTPRDYDLVLSSETGNMCRLDPETGEVVWRRDDLPHRYGAGVRDLDGDGVGDFLAVRRVWDDEMLVLSGRDGSTIWSQNYGSFDLMTGTPEVIEGPGGELHMLVAAQLSWGGGVRRYRCSDGAVIWTCPDQYNNATILGLMRRADGGSTVLCGWRHRHLFFALDADTGVVLWDGVPGPNSDRGAFVVADMTGDGSEDVISHGGDGYARLYDGVSGVEVEDFDPIDGGGLFGPIFAKFVPPLRLSVPQETRLDCRTAVPVSVETGVPVRAFSLAFTYPRAVAKLVAIRPGAALGDVQSRGTWDVNLDAPVCKSGLKGATLGSVFSLGAPWELPPGRHEIAILEFERTVYDPLIGCGSGEIEFRDGCIGNPPVSIVIVTPDGDKVPETQAGTLIAGETCFVRGDADSNAKITIGDPVKIVYYLFAGEGVRCEDALDVNDNGEVTVTDAVLLVGYLFRGWGPPAPPFPSAGVDPTYGDGLPCLPCE